jgi:hypothetical protein
LFYHDRLNGIKKLRVEDLLAHYAQGEPEFESQNLEQANFFESVLPRINLCRSRLNRAWPTVGFSPFERASAISPQWIAGQVSRLVQHLIYL